MTVPDFAEQPIFQAFADESDESIYSRLWADLLPSGRSGREFSIRVTNKSHPWGFDVGCNVLNVKAIRRAISDFTGCSPAQLGNYDISSLRLRGTWPVDAGCPVPLSLLLKWFDLYGASLQKFEDRILRWINSNENQSKKRPVLDDDVAKLCREIGKYHRGLGHLSAYRVFANVLRQELIESDEGIDEETSALEGLFTRLNTMGSRISPYDLRYSAIKAYWGNIKERNDKIAAKIMPGATLAVLAIRLAMTIAEERNRKAGTSCKIVDVPSVLKIRKLGKGTDLEAKDLCARRILLEELYAGGLERLIDKVEISFGL